jgi:hypothetical protein
MSLKAFHLVFITASCAMAVGCGVWGLKNYWTPDGRWHDLLFGVGSLATAVGLIAYERYFLKKLRDVDYL